MKDCFDAVAAVARLEALTERGITITTEVRDAWIEAYQLAVRAGENHEALALIRRCPDHEHWRAAVQFELERICDRGKQPSAEQ